MNWLVSDTDVKSFEEQFRGMSKHQIEAVITQANNILKDKYKKPRKPKYGNLSKYIIRSKWEEILNATHRYKFRFIFYLMRKLALRVGEITQIRLKDIDLEHKQILIPCTEKSHMPDICYLDNEASQKIKEWIESNYDNITGHEGFIFCPEKRSHSNRSKICEGVIRKEFRKACKLANVQISYGLTKRTNYHLNLYTTHSCRHSGITDFYLKTKNIKLTQIYARHQNINSTLVYIHHTEDDMRQAIEKKQIGLAPDEFKEFLEVFKEFKQHQRMKNHLNMSTAI